MANFGNFRVVGTPYFMGPILPPALPKWHLIWKIQTHSGVWYDGSKCCESFWWSFSGVLWIFLPIIYIGFSEPSYFQPKKPFLNVKIWKSNGYFPFCWLDFRKLEKVLLFMGGVWYGMVKKSRESFWSFWRLCVEFFSFRCHLQNPLTKLKNKFGNIPVPVNVYTHHGPYALRR